MGAGVSDVELIDTMGRGVLDLVVTNQTTGLVSVLRNLGGRQFGSPVPYRAGTGLLLASGTVSNLDATAGVVAGAFTTGESTDLLTVNPGSNTLGLLAGLGLGRFANPVSIETAEPAQVVRVADFNHDGIPDLAVLTADTVDICLGNGHGGFSKPVSYNAGPEPTGLSVAELGSGQVDLLIGDAYGDVLVLAGQGDGTFRPLLDSGNSVALAVADLTGKGTKDLIIADQGLDRVSVHYNGGQGIPVGAGSSLLAPGAVTVADLNGDGIPDLIVANSGGNNVLIYPGLGNGQFGPALNGGKGFFTGTDPVGVTVANLNGRPDLIVADKGSNDVTILLNQATAGGGFTLVPGPRLNLKTATQQGVGPVATAIIPSTSGAASSLAVSLSGSNQVWVIPSVGGGFFNDQKPTIFDVGTSPGPIFVGTFDGHPDLVTVNAGSNDLTVISDFASPDFTTQTISSGGLDPVTAFAFNSGGGFESLVVGNNGDGVLALLQGGADGLTLTSTLRASDVPSPTALAFSALTGGQVEFFAATAGREDAISIEMSLGVETIAAPTPTATNTLAQLVPLSESSLALVGTLLPLSLENPGSEDGSEAQAEAETAVVFLTSPGPSVNQPLPGQIGSESRVDEGEEGSADLGVDSAETQEPADSPSRARSTWKRYILGIEEAPEPQPGDPRPATGDEPAAWVVPRSSDMSIDPVAPSVQAVRELPRDVSLSAVIAAFGAARFAPFLRPRRQRAGSLTFPDGPADRPRQRRKWPREGRPRR